MFGWLTYCFGHHCDSIYTTNVFLLVSVCTRKHTPAYKATSRRPKRLLLLPCSWSPFYFNCFIFVILLLCYVCVSVLFSYRVEWHRECIFIIFVNWPRNLVPIVCRLCILFSSLFFFFSFFQFALQLLPAALSFTACVFTWNFTLSWFSFQSFLCIDLPNVTFFTIVFAVVFCVFLCFIFLVLDRSLSRFPHLYAGARKVPKPQTVILFRFYSFFLVIIFLSVCKFYLELATYSVTGYWIGAVDKRIKQKFILCRHHW